MANSDRDSSNPLTGSSTITVTCNDGYEGRNNTLTNLCLSLCLSVSLPLVTWGDIYDAEYMMIMYNTCFVVVLFCPLHDNKTHYIPDNPDIHSYANSDTNNLTICMCIPKVVALLSVVLTNNGLLSPVTHWFVTLPISLTLTNSTPRAL